MPGLVIGGQPAVVLGTERKITLSPDERERTAYHESGHALVGMLTPDADPVRKVSIIPRGQALGVTLSTPDADRVSYSRDELDTKIKVSLGGRVAEEVVYDELTTGAESDLQQLTQIARQMVGRWGMSDKLGPITVLPSDGQGPLLPGASETSLTPGRSGPWPSLGSTETGPILSLMPHRPTIWRAIWVSCWMSDSAPVVIRP